MSRSLLDPGQIIQTVFDEDSGAVKTTSSVGNPDVIASYEVDYSSINGSGGALYEFTSSTADATTQILIYDTTGVGMSVYTGGSGSETVKIKVGPGNDMLLPCVIAASTRLTIRATGTSAPTAGKVNIVLIG